MNKPSLLLIQPAQDKDRLGSRRRRKSSIPKLSLPVLASMADGFFDIQIIDESVEDIDFTLRPDLVGISVITQLAPRAYEIADFFKDQGIKVVMGGFHASFFPEQALDHADAVVIGEAEGVWGQVLEDFLGGNLQKTYKSESPHNLSGLKRPRLDLLKRNAYSFNNVLETARGCPHRCSFCAVSKFWGRKFRFRPVEEVIDEIQAMPPGDLVIVDDNIIGSPARSKELFEALIPLKRRWSGQADIRIARDLELLELAARSGCKWLFIGIESINEDNLKAIGKSKVNVASRYKESIAAIRKAGIKVFGSFILGFDGDDKDSFERTVKFCEDNRLEGANFYIFTPLPFTDVFDEYKKDNRILHYDWSRYDCNHVVFKPARMTPEELLEGYLSTYRSFYSSGSICRRLLSLRKDLPELLALNIGRYLNYRRFEEGCRI